MPCLGVDLDDWLAVIGKNVGLVISLQPLQDIHGSLIERHSVGAADLVLIRTHPQMPTLSSGDNAMSSLDALPAATPATEGNQFVTKIQKGSLLLI